MATKNRKKIPRRVKSRRSGKPAKRKVLLSAGARYMLNSDFEFFNELRALILKSSPTENDKLIRRINKLGRIRLAVISGIFLNNHGGTDTGNALADLFIVGDDVDKNRLRIFLKWLESEVGAEIKFSLMEKEGFDYRHGMFDRFVRVLLEGPHEKIINKIGI